MRLQFVVHDIMKNAYPTGNYELKLKIANCMNTDRYIWVAKSKGGSDGYLPKYSI